MMSLRALLPLFLLWATTMISADTISGSTKKKNVVQINDHVAIEILSSSILRVVRSQDGSAAASSSLVVLDEARQADVKYSVATHDDTVVVKTEHVAAFGSISTGRIDFWQGETALIKEGSSSLDPYNVTQEWHLQSQDEAVYGGGQYVNGFLNYRSAPIRMTQFNTEAVVPFVQSSRKYGILWDWYGETMMNQPQEEIELDEHFQGTFTPSSSEPYWFYLEVCQQGWGCRGNAVKVTLTDSNTGASRVVCEHDLDNLPKSTACRVDGLTQGTTYKVNYEGEEAFAHRKLFVTAMETHNRLTLQQTTTTADPVIDYYFMVSPDGTQEGVLQNYRRLTGTAYLYPQWVYGFWQCKEHYHNQTELLEAAQRFRALQIPVDSFVQDWQYWGSLGWGPQWDPALYPSPKSMMDTLHDSNIHFMVSVWSKFANRTRFYQEMNQKGVIIQDSIYMDAWHPVAQQLFYKYAKETHFDLGADALWLDATEPENYAQKGHDIYLGKGDDYANTYSLMVAKAVQEGLVNEYPHRRVFSLTRSSFAGQQRYGASLWSGDTTGSWDSLRRQIGMSINYQLSGIPYWSMDTGGFYRPKDQYTSTDYHHLLIRWFQFAVFTPIFRVHGCASNTELWNYPQNVQDTIVQTAIRFRYRLLEYVYSGFWKVETQHSTMQRGLILDFAHDKKVQEIADEFLFGQSFLVAPLYRPDSSRSIYLPRLVEAGSKWRCFYSGNELEDGQTLRFDNVTLDRIPLFVRSSILVLGADGRQHVKDPIGNGKLEVRVYDGTDSKFELFEDDGISADPNRPTTTIVFSWNEQTRTLTIGDAIGDAKTRSIDIVLVRPGIGVGIDPVAQPDATITYKGTAVSVSLPSVASTTTL